MAQSVLVYNRIAENRRKTIVLLTAAMVSLIPLVAAAGYGVSQLVVFRFTPFPETSAARLEEMRKALPADRRDLFEADLERRVEAEKRAREAYTAETEKTRWRVRILVTAVLAATWSIVFWQLASSPVSRLMAQNGARPAGADDLAAKRLLENLAIGAGLPAPRLYIIDSRAPNAFAAGLDPSRSVVAVTRGLLDLLDRRELEGVLAHELSHIGNRDTRLNTILAAALVLRMPDVLDRHSPSAGLKTGGAGDRAEWRYRACAVLACPVLLYAVLIAPALMALVRAAVSRSREFRADADAALLTRYPEGLLRALAKIQGAGAAISRSNPAYAHLFFADPTVGGVGAGLFTGKLLATHPPIQERIERLAEYHGGLPASVIEKAVQAGAAFRDQAAPGKDTGDRPALAASVEGADSRMTGRHLGIAAGFGVAVFVAVLMLLVKFGGK